LKYEFDIISFIDSCAWGYSDDLLRMLDDEYCLQKESNTLVTQRLEASLGNVYGPVIGNLQLPCDQFKKIRL